MPCTRNWHPLGWCWKITSRGKKWNGLQKPSCTTQNNLTIKGYDPTPVSQLTSNAQSAGSNMLNVNQPTDNNSRLFFLMSHAKFYLPLFQEILWKDITNSFLSMWANFHGKLLSTRCNCWRLIYRLLIEVCWCPKKLRWGLFLAFSVLTKLISMKTFSSSLLTIDSVVFSTFGP